jgi:Leucine-rich repeat (LRR) protein
LTSLEHIDLSYNELEEILTTPNESFPLNLTVLDVRHNKLEALPLKELLKANLSRFDLSGNMVKNFSEELSYMIENGTIIEIYGNLCSLNFEMFLISKTNFRQPVRLQLSFKTCSEVAAGPA